LAGLSFSSAQCAAGVNEFTVFADPGKYEFHSFEQLLLQRRYWAAKEQELKLLMDKARQSTGARRSAWSPARAITSWREELKVIDATARIKKKCKLPDDLQNNSAAR
jgi:hypothetical protein